MSDIASILGQPFDPSTEKASSAWEPMPAGWYNAFIEKEEIKATKAGDGHYLNLQFSIADGLFQGRRVFTKIHLANPSVKCVEIGKADLAALTLAMHIPLLQDTAQLVHGAVQIRVVLRNDQNDIKGYKPSSATPLAPAQPPALAEPPRPVRPIAPTTPVAPAQLAQPMAPIPPPAPGVAPLDHGPNVEPWKR